MVRPWGAAADALGLGFSTTMACVVNTIPATEAAFCKAHLVTLAGSITPASTKFSYLSVIALYPTSHSLFFIFSTTTSPSIPAFWAINAAGATSACVLRHTNQYWHPTYNFFTHFIGINRITVHFSTKCCKLLV